MKNMLVITLFMLATLAWAAAQQPGGTPGQSSGQPGSQGQAPNVPVTEGCLGGSNPNFTITDKAGTTYKLNIPPSADTSKLAQHVGESVQVAGNVKDTGKAGMPQSKFKASVEERASAQPAVRRARSHRRNSRSKMIARSRESRQSRDFLFLVSGTYYRVRFGTDG